MTHGHTICHIKIPSLVSVKFVHLCSDSIKIQICSKFSKFNGKLYPFIAIVNSHIQEILTEMYI
jgi:hypothetical protein